MSNLFKTPKPKVETPRRMPDEHDPVAEERRRRARSAALAGKGRASTILSEGAGASSGPYTRQKLG